MLRMVFVRTAKEDLANGCGVTTRVVDASVDETDNIL